MLTRSVTQAVALASIAVGLAAVPMACAAAVDAPLEAQAGTGGEGGGSTSASASATSATSSTAATTGTGPAGPCTSAEDCAALQGACTTGTCINGVCEGQAANELGACDDGLFCTSNDACHEGVCSGSPTTCPSGDTCSTGACDPVTDACVLSPGNEGSPCADDDPCTLSGVCTGGTCAPGALTDCSFLDGLCSVGACDPQVGCVVMPQNDGTACDDNLYCTVNDACAGGQCKGAANTCAPPGDICQIGVCDEATDTCVSTPGNDGLTCDDGSACTAGEKCGAGQCSGGQPANQGGACTDGDACTTIDTCANGACIGAGAIVSCTGGDGCCPAGCDLASDDDCAPACCGDDINPFPTSNACSQGAVWITWEYLPGCSYDLTRLELHSAPGSVALLADGNNFPGAVLFQGALGAPDAQGWAGADVAPAIPLVGGQRYWIAESVNVCSIAQSGTAQVYYGSFNTLAGPWDGPFQGGNFWTAHAIGACD